MNDEKFIRPLADCFMSRESWALFCRKNMMDPEEKEGNLLLSPEKESQFKEDVLAGCYKFVLLDHNHRALAQQMSYEDATNVKHLTANGHIDKKAQQAADAKASSLRLINLTIHAGTQRTHVDELVTVREVLEIPNIVTLFSR